MPAVATGNTYKKGERWYARLTLAAKKRPKIPLPTCKTSETAETRGALLADMAKSLRGKNVPVDVARTLLLSAGKAAEGKALDKARRTIEAVCSGDARPKGDASKPSTFRAVAERWTSGELARQYPDRVSKLERGDLTHGLLEKHVFPLVGDVLIVGFTLDHAEDVMRTIPASHAPATRRRIAKTMARVLSLAVFPLRIITAHPLPKGFLPKVGDGKAKGYLYPAEDALLLAGADVPLCWRFFYGFLHREGPRANEAIRFDVGDVDPDRGSITLDKNKTDDPRSWALDPGVARALRASIALRETAEGAPLSAKAPLFVDEDGRRIHASNLAAQYRAHLAAAGIDRAELFATTDARRQIRLHDTRATFITNNLANGRSETWVQDRTGHKSSAQINGYRRQARKAAELNLGPLAPLDTAIPELRPGGPNGAPDGSGEAAPGASGSGPSAPNGGEASAEGGGNPGRSCGTLPLDPGGQFRRD